MMNKFERTNLLLGECIRSFQLDLNGLVILTEAATGPYMYTPIMAALAGARKVYAITADSMFGNRDTVKRLTMAAALRWRVADRIQVIYEKTKAQVHESDIITNSGFVRPINREMISWMKSTAVIPLMWETWEFRRDDLDLRSCKEHQILVLGTDESKPPLSIYSYSGYLAMKLLFDLGLEGLKTRTLLIGSGEVCRRINNHFKQLKMDITWFSASDDGSLPYHKLSEYFMKKGAEYDVAILAEHINNICLLGNNGLLSYETIRRINPALFIGVIAGNLDLEGLKASRLYFYPDTIRPFGYISYDLYQLGPRPVLELYAAGLKVGQTMAHARKTHKTVEEAAAYTLNHSPAMDFVGGEAWIRSKV
jgi:hypothetical protein